ncbi:hypothetical protein Esi_0392_0018 [Ectocarpus siliculosus]|uniref:Uncharacterized protein n=1 Tax=Ectocarpus siliculosus TaxID=2880 RepID=D8LM82_ECTSI|nr:hypothetical protein Esi_0392_0018 [Ectocarpus siliculosus]|eukprot:CBN79715.1 hypothetical protein Esi_0392_0018 [Ectocarpus siliculosus]
MIIFDGDDATFFWGDATHAGSSSRSFVSPRAPLPGPSTDRVAVARPTVNTMVSKRTTPVCAFPPPPPSTTSHLRISKAGRSIAANIVGRLRTAIETGDACDMPAAGLLDMSGKCAAMKARLGSSSKRCPTEVQRLTELLSSLFSMWANIKSVIRNSNEWVSLTDQKEAMDLFGLHLAHSHALLRNIKNSTSTASFWPEVETNEALQTRTARFTAKCILKGEVISNKQQQQQQQQKKKQGQLASPYSPSSPSRRDRTNKSFRPSACSPRHEGGTASFSDDATDTPSTSTSPLSSSLSSFFSASSAHTFTGSENITEAPPCKGRQKKHAPSKVPVSPGVAFVPYRSPTSRTNPRGSSLRGSGAIAGRKTRF